MNAGPPRSGRDDATVKLDRRLAGMSRLVASAKGITLVEYLSEAARPVIERDFVSRMKEIGSRDGTDLREERPCSVSS